MKIRHFLLALAWLGCSSTPDTPSHYERGTYPVTPPLRPGHGLPQVGQPSVTVRTLPQPQPIPQRHLPQTPETQRQPGIWASDERADEPELTSLILGIPLDFPDDAETDVERAPTLTCATLMHGALVGSGTEARLRHRDRQTRECAAATLYVLCAELTIDALDKATAAGTDYDAIRDRGFRKARDAARRQARRACPPPPDPIPESDTIQSALNYAVRHGFFDWKAK